MVLGRLSHPLTSSLTMKVRHNRPITLTHTRALSLEGRNDTHTLTLYLSQVTHTYYTHSNTTQITLRSE